MQRYYFALSLSVLKETFIYAQILNTKASLFVITVDKKTKKLMRKILLIAGLVLVSMVGYAQTGEKSVVGKLGYQTEFKRFLVGAEGRYNVTDEVRIAPDVQFLFPKNKTTGLDFNVNVHYLFRLADDLKVYPLAGGAMLNNHWSGGDGISTTNFGFNVGGGLQYDLASDAYVDFQFKYTFLEDAKDPAYFTVGYGIRF